MRYGKMPPAEAQKQRDFLERVGAIRSNYWMPPPKDSPTDYDAWWENLVRTIDEAGEEFEAGKDPFVEALLFILIEETESRLSGESGRWLERLEAMSQKWFKK